MGIHAMIQSTDKYPGESTRVDASRSLKKFLLMVGKRKERILEGRLAEHGGGRVDAENHTKILNPFLFSHCRLDTTAQKHTSQKKELSCL